MRAGSPFFLALLVAGCSSTGGLPTGTDDLAMAPLPPDLAAPLPDLAMKPGDMAKPIVHDLAYVPRDAGPLSCGTQTCALGDVCCIEGGLQNPTFSCAKTCGDGGLTIMCQGPENCGGNPCCVDVAFSGGALVPKSTGTCGMTANDCQVAFNFTSIQNISITTRRCHADAECGGNGNTCCTANLQGTALQVCVSPTILGAANMFGGGMIITCP